MMLRTILATAVLYLLLASPSRAGFNEGKAAYNRGDYATAAGGHKKAVKNRELVRGRMMPACPG
jgi:hypothetical protein